jgi:light-regulated signal transduction histidine kinase (bacteriophytochrome)
MANEYAAALREYLAQGGEAALSKAYEFGRRAVEGGVLELTTLHHQALATVVAEADPSVAERVRKAAEFFTDVVSPLEMAVRSYKDTTSVLLDLNTRLGQQNEELGRAKRATEEANRELEAFSYSVAHDLRAPLRSIDGFSQALLDDYDAKLDAEGRGYLQHVREAAREMGQLIDDLLQLSRVSRGELARAKVDLGQLARTILERLQRGAKSRSVAVEIEPGLEAFVDGRLVAIALENLLGNAWKFTSKRPDARISVGALPGPEKVFFIRDNGAGFDPAYAHRLFGVFQRLHSDQDFEGTGVGLATVQRIVRRHDGRIWAEGALGQGATFFFTLPAPASPRGVGTE